VRFHVEVWDPDFGGSADTDLAEPEGVSVELDVEVPAARWEPIQVPPPHEGITVAFVDGVQRVDARVWVETAAETRMGLCASYAAGTVRCGRRADIARVEVERGLFITPGPGVDGIRTELADYPLRAVAGEGVEALRQGLHERMTALEARVAREARPADLVVVDGHLKGRADIPRVVGYIKRHYVAYLNERQEILGRLKPGERTPLFLVTSSWTRYSWYVRLPGATGYPWAGIARCEASPDLSVADARGLADLTAAVLPPFASQSYQDPRAPQNLLPIAGLERELRRRLGERELLLRALHRLAG
jgi:hypothetical protein